MAGKVKDLTGKRFGSLVVIRREKNEKGIGGWLCQCDCGKQAHRRTGSLNSWQTISCGCLARNRRDKDNAEATQRKEEMIKTWSDDMLLALFRVCTSPRLFNLQIVRDNQ